MPWAIHFRDGQDIEQGKKPFTIDERLFKADLDKAEAALDKAEKHLKPLPPTTTGKETTTEARRHRSGGIRQDGRLTSTKRRPTLNMPPPLSKPPRRTSISAAIYAPFDGRLSTRMQHEGDLVQANQTLLTTIVYLDEMYVTFDVDERTVRKIRELIHKARRRRRGRNRGGCKSRWPTTRISR